MENFDGQTVLNLISEQNYIANVINADAFEKEMINNLVEDLSLDRINLVKLIIGGGIENNGQTISLEISPEVLPLRYVTEYKKLIHPEIQVEPKVILIFESNDISQSKMKIRQLGTLKEFADNRLEKIAEINQLIETDFKNK